MNWKKETHAVHTYTQFNKNNNNGKLASKNNKTIWCVFSFFFHCIFNHLIKRIKTKQTNSKLRSKELRKQLRNQLRWLGQAFHCVENRRWWRWYHYCCCYCYRHLSAVSRLSQLIVTNRIVVTNPVVVSNGQRMSSSNFTHSIRV